MQTTNHIALTGLAVLFSTLSFASEADAAQAEYRQLDWEHQDAGLIQFSRVGEVEFHWDLSDPQDQLLLKGGAFINVVLDLNGDGQPQWVVRNLFIAYPHPEHMAASSPSVMFPLPIEQGQFVEQAFVGMLLSPEPFFDLPPVEIQPVPFDHVIHRSGGFQGGGSEGYDLPFFIQDWGINFNPFLILPIDIAWTHTAADDLPKVDEEKEGCAPGSAARSIEYLGDLFGFPTDSAQDIYDDLKGEMGTSVGENGTGTSVPNFLSGKKAYTQGEGLPIDTEQKFGIGDLCDIMDDINNGADVEIMISWGNGRGHAAMITSVIKWSDGSYTITYVDDPTQGDGMAENEEHTIHVNPDGTLVGGGSIIGFQIEKVRDGDLNDDGVIDTADLLEFLASWGECDDANCPADLTGDGSVGTDDLLLLLALWGAGA